jgi:mRNA interferase RelE/StbE
VSRYEVYTLPEAWDEMKNLPGHMRQRVRRAVKALADDPRPTGSKQLDAPSFERELRRLQLDKWRIVYVITESESTVDVLAVRKRPPYDYGDLTALLESLR